MIKKKVYYNLKNLIIKSEFEPNQKLSEINLSKQFNVSRTPIRESLIKLEQEGLVDIIPQKGTFVSKINKEEVKEAQFIRESLEISTLKLLSSFISDEQVMQLREIINQQIISLRAKKIMDFFHLDEKFHRTMANMAGYKMVWDVIKETKVPIDRIRMLSLPILTEVELMIFQHREIVTSLIDNNPKKIEENVKTHLSEVIHSIDKLSKRYYDYFI